MGFCAKNYVKFGKIGFGTRRGHIHSSPSPARRRQVSVKPGFLRRQIRYTGGNFFCWNESVRSICWEEEAGSRQLEKGAWDEANELRPSEIKERGTNTFRNLLTA